MTAYIIPFPRPGAPDRREEFAQAQAVNDAERRRVIRELRETLSLRTGGKKLHWKLRHDNDAIMLARGLGSELERIKKSGRGDLTKVLENAGQTLNTRARYALFKSDDPPKGKRVRKLQPYVRLSDEIAEFLKRDKDLYLYDKLDGLGVLKSKQSSSEQSSDDVAVELKQFIEQMAKKVAEQTKIAEFFDLAANTLGDMDENGVISPSNDRVLRYRPYEGWPDYPEDPRQPIPLVPILRIRERTLPGRARIAPWVEGTPENFSDLFRAVDDEGADITDIAVEIWREFSLSLCECSWPPDVRPMFAGRPQCRIVIGDTVAHHPLYPWTAALFCPPFDQNPTPLTDGRRWTACRLEVEIGDDFSDNWIEPAMPPDHPEGAFYYFEHYYFSTHPVNVWNIRRLLDVCEHIRHAESLLPDIEEEEADLIYRLPGRIGQRFEAALYTGRLETALSDAIERMKTELTGYRVERQAALAAQDDVMLARWRSPETTDIEEPRE